MMSLANKSQSKDPLSLTQRLSRKEVDVIDTKRGLKREDIADHHEKMNRILN